MKNKLQKFLDEAFAPYGEFPARSDVMQELLSNLLEKFENLKIQGKADDEAYQATIDSFGDVAEIMESVPHTETKKHTESSLPKSLLEDYLGISVGKSKFKGVVLKQADLSDIELIDENFTGSGLEKIVFDNSNLTNTTFKGAALKGASFRGAILIGATFDGSDLRDICFDDANLSNARLKNAGLQGSTFSGATLVNTDFSGSDLTEISFDDQTLDAVIFDSSSLKMTSFKNTIFHDVSFHHTAAKHAIFDGSSMDKATYALLKGANATLHNITII